MSELLASLHKRRSAPHTVGAGRRPTLVAVPPGGKALDGKALCDF